jgi:multiple sugar transport system substrate-binding protein
VRSVRAHGTRAAVARSPRRLAGPLAALMLAGPALVACSDEPEPEPAPPSATAGRPVELTFGVQGPAEEVDAWRRVVEAWNAGGPDVGAELVTGRPAVTLDGELPDVFLATRDDLPELLEEGLVQPVGEPLDERGVDFGDGYSRDALQAFSADDDLQCMPYGISPTVMYVNTELVDFERMAARGLDVPSSATQWTFAQFAAAARFATRPRSGVRSVHVDPTIEGLAPWVLAGGGEVYDDSVEPTSLALSSDESVAALETLLQVLRSPEVTPTPQQLSRATPVQLFERGRLAMLPGDRSLVPRLRRAQGISFDVRQMPRLEGDATTGTVTGLCIAAGAETDAAADFLLHLLDPDSVAAITREGHLVPAELEVAQSPAFLQPGRQPAHPEAFLDAVRDIAMLPEVDEEELGDLVGPALRSMFYDTVIELDELTASIDELSASLLAPEELEEGGEGEEGPAEDEVVPTPTESPGQ